MPYIIGSVLAVAIFTITWCGKHLTPFAAVLMSAIVALFAFGSLWRPLFLLFVSYGLLMAIDKATRKARKSIRDNVNQNADARTAMQLMANGLCAAISATLFMSTENRAFLVVYAVGVGETFVDNIASDIGALSNHMPRDVCTWKPISSGLSGGISALGTVTSGAASVTFGAMAFFSWVYLGVKRSS